MSKAASSRKVFYSPFQRTISTSPVAVAHFSIREERSGSDVTWQVK